MSLHPTHKAVSISSIQQDYGAFSFIAALQRFVVQYQHPTWTPAQVVAHAYTVYLPFQCLPLYHRIKFVSQDHHAVDPTHVTVVDSIHIDLPSKNKYKKTTPGRFDTVLVNCNQGEMAGVQGYSVAQVCCVFTLPEKARLLWFPNGCRFKYFAYVEWFHPFARARIDPSSTLYRVSRVMVEGNCCKASIIPVNYITQSIHLFPKFRPSVPPD